MPSIAIIPARGGSKRIPRKNIRPFCGRPMIAWSIAAAQDSQLFTQIIVSTDDPDIADVARAEGALVPFLRPPELADDFTPTVPVIAHAIKAAQAGEAAAVCCLYATAPFVRPADLRRGLACLEQSDCDFVFSVTSYAFPIQRALRLLPGERVEMMMPEHQLSRSQDLEEAWHDAGQFYWGRAEAWLDGRQIMGPGSCALPLPRYRVQDIDTLEDWQRAELMFQALQQQEQEQS